MDLFWVFVCAKYIFASQTHQFVGLVWLRLGSRSLIRETQMEVWLLSVFVSKMFQLEVRDWSLFFMYGLFFFQTSLTLSHAGWDTAARPHGPPARAARTFRRAVSARKPPSAVTPSPSWCHPTSLFLSYALHPWQWRNCHYFQHQI